MIKTFLLNRWIKPKTKRQQTLNKVDDYWELEDKVELNWCSEEEQVLQKACRNHQFFSMEFDSIPKPFQTSLIQFHPSMNRLVIDTLVPSLPAALHNLQLFGWLHIPLALGYLKLRVSIERADTINNYQCFVCQIHQKQVVKDRRNQPRVHFSSGHAPSVKFTLPLSSEISAEIDNLSTGGVAARCYRRDFPQLLSKQGDCAISFGENLKIKAQCEVKSVRLMRQPSYHYHLRVSFLNMSAQKSDQLNALIAELAN